MKPDIKNAFTQGLLQGYGLKSFRNTLKGGVPGLSSDLYLPTGAHYHDHWFGETSSAGQETVIVGDDRYSRSYGGGIVDPATLDRLGITSQEIHEFLTRQLQSLGARTRLTTRCFPPAEGPWKYEYNIDRNMRDPEITTATEEILYGPQRVRVFRHNFILTPIR